MNNYNIIFYTYGSTLELNGVQFELGSLSEDLLNLSPALYRPLHQRMERITVLEEINSDRLRLSTWWELNEEMQTLCSELRKYKVFRLLLDESEDRYFSVARQITGQRSFFPEERSSEEGLYKRIERFCKEYIQRSHRESDEQKYLDLFDPDCGDEDMYYEMLLAMGATDETWMQYRRVIERYRGYLHDIRAFNTTIGNFIKYGLSQLKVNSPETYAQALYGFYNDRRIADKLIVNPIRNNGDCYTTHDSYMLSYVPRELPDGSVAICQEHVTDSLQALMKADYTLALNHGYNIRRCIICGRYFLVKGGAHALYCEGACPHAPDYTCRQFGAVEVQKELAKDNPKLRAKQTAFSRITKDMQRGAISQEDARRAKDYVRDELYEALRRPDISEEMFAQTIASDHVYKECGITRSANPRGRPPKQKEGGDQ